MSGSSAEIEVQRDGTPARLFPLVSGAPIVIGRSDEADVRVDGDPKVSRRHVEIRFHEGQLTVKRLPGSSNPVFHRGAEATEFSLAPGDHFVIGATRFVLVAREARPEDAARPAPSSSHTLSAADLYAMNGGSERMLLSNLIELPEILSTKTSEEAYLHVASLLRMATGGRWARIASENGAVLAEDWSDDRNKNFTTSRSLVAQALKDSPRPTIYRWSSLSKDLQATVQEGIDWVICAAAKVAGSPPLIFYVGGQGGDEASQRDGGRFVGLVADMVGRSISIKHLENWQGRLQHYFSEAIVSQIIRSNDLGALKPRLAQSTIMFFDIRGFSKRTEGKNDKILAYQDELRAVMTSMTGIILKENGVVIQYQGDAILACWNLPIADPAHVDRACRTALGMVSTLAGIPGDWRCGIGLHTGEVVAGSVGSDQVWSYSVLGAVVNQASRLEGITKAVGVPLLVSKEVAQAVSPEVAATLRVGRFQPAGMTVALDLYELMPPPGDPERVAIFQKGLEAFERGEWEAAYEALDHLPSKDLPARYIKSLSEQHRRHPPKDWRGVIELNEK